MSPLPRSGCFQDPLDVLQRRTGLGFDPAANGSGPGPARRVNPELAGDEDEAAGAHGLNNYLPEKYSANYKNVWTRIESFFSLTW